MQLTEAGVVWVEPRVCEPLEELVVSFEWQQLAGHEVTFEVADAAHRCYLVQTVRAGEGRAELRMRPAGTPGVHHVRLTVARPGEGGYVRNGSFRMCARTVLRTDDPGIEELFGLLEEGLRQTVDVTVVNGKRRLYYKAADNSRQNLAYPAYGIGGLRYFVADLKTMFEAVYDNQWPSGRLPDHVYGDNYPWAGTPRRLRTCMADLETGVASTLCLGWEAHGDNEWLAELLPKVEAGLEYVTTDPQMFDAAHGLIKRPHTLDEWDIAFTETAEQAFTDETCKFVLMQGDTSQLVYACSLLARALAALGQEERSQHYARLAGHYRQAGNALFWDGVKYRGHVHLDPFDHGDFDEADQLTMSNAGALTREFAEPEQALSIIEEYVRRWESSGDAFPWWSLQPGYPDRLGYFKRDSGAWTRGEGEYCNGGLFPWVGGELCRAALRHGREALACRLLRDLLAVMRRDGGALFTWYDRHGAAAINAPHHQTNYDPWGLGPWTQALVEELAGIATQGRLLSEVVCAPRWPAAGVSTAAATAHFPASDTYFSYRYELTDASLRLHFTGTGRSVRFRLLLPGWPGVGGVTLNGDDWPAQLTAVQQSPYLLAEAPISGAGELVVHRAG